MATNIGLNVIEVDGAGAPAIVGVAVSVGAFNVTTRRGVPNRPARINSFPQFVEQFGGFFPGSLGAYMVKGFFDNGGQTAFVNRVVALDPTTGAKPATLTLKDRAGGGGVNTLTLRAGFRGTPDPGSWGSDLFVRVAAATPALSRLRESAPATVTAGTALGAQTNMSALPSLSVAVDGETSPTLITFQNSDFANPAQATRNEIRDAINKRTNKLVASLNGTNNLVLTSAGQGATPDRFTSLRVTADNNTLGFTTATNPTLGTAVAPTANGAQLFKGDDFEVGDAVEISDGTRVANVKLRRIVAATGAVEWDPAVANINTFDTALTRFRSVGFDLTVALGGTDDANVVETFPGLSMEPEASDYALRRINDGLGGSRYLVASNENSGSGVGVKTPVALTWTRLNPGQETTPSALEFVGDAAKHTGFFAFDSYDVQLLCCELTDPTIVRAGLDYCANRGDCMYLGSVPEAVTPAGQAGDYGRKFQGKKVYGALYAPWIKVFDPLSTGANPVKHIPPTGHIMGVFARIETNRGIWKAPAGDEASIAGALDVEYRLTDAEHTDLVRNASVNGVRAVPGAGIVIDASRTLSTDTRWLYVNVRLLFNFVKSSLKQGLRWVRQEPNRDTLWNAVKFNSINPFLLGLWRQGAFGTGTPAQVFTVICDETNNPPDQVDQGIFKVEVYFYPSKPAETILIIVGQQPSGATAAEA